MRIDRITCRGLCGHVGRVHVVGSRQVVVPLIESRVVKKLRRTANAGMNCGYEGAFASHFHCIDPPISARPPDATIVY